MPSQAQDVTAQLDLFNLQTKPEHVRSSSSSARALFLVAGDLSDDSKRILGKNGADRFGKFKRYRQGWEHGQGEPLSSRSVRLLDFFLRRLPELSTLEPSLFLTDPGNLQLGWTDDRGGMVELEFFPDKIEYYLESLNEENSVPSSEQGMLLEKVKSILK